MARYTPNDFARRLAEDDLSEPIVIEGLAKSDTNNAVGLLFSPDGHCETWVAIPPEIVESVEHLGKSPCKDHTHPKVRLHLKEPAANNVAATAFAALLRMALGGQISDNGQPSDDARREPSGRCTPRRGPCRPGEDGLWYQTVTYRDCSTEMLDCSPPPPPPSPKTVAVQYARWGDCTSDGGGNPRTQTGSFFLVTGSGFVPHAACHVRAHSHANAQRGIQSTTADASGRIELRCFWADYPGPGVDLTFVAHDHADGGSGSTTHSP